MGLLLSVSVIPWIKTALRPGNPRTLRDLLLANGDTRPEGSQAGTLDPNSSQSNGTSNGNSHRSLRLTPNLLDFAHLGVFQMHTSTGTEGSASDIDLEEGLRQPYGTNPGSEGSEYPLL